MMVALAGAIFGLALAALLIPLLPTQPRLSAAMANLESAEDRAAPQSRSGLSPRGQRLGRWAERRLGGLPFLSTTPSASDLALLGRTSTQHYYSKLRLAVLMLLLGLLLSTYSVILPIPVALPMLVALVLALLGWRIPDQKLVAEAKEARVQYTRAIGAFVEIVATERRRGAPISMALSRAAALSDGWVFQQIRHELIRADYDHQPPWTALEKLADRIGISKLAEAARVANLSGTEGAEVYGALRGMGRNMRLELLSEEQARSNRATEKLNLSITGLAGVFVAMVLVPTMLTLFTSS